MNPRARAEGTANAPDPRGAHGVTPAPVPVPVTAAVGPVAPAPRVLDLRGRALVLDRPRVMGILNLTPDSFYDGGRYTELDAARARAEALAEEGADLLDLGAVSTRPGSAPVPVEEELRRLLPVLAAIRRTIDLPLTIDTFRPEVARAAADMGADGINDVTGLADSDALARLAAELNLGLVLMHMRGTPATMQEDTEYADLVGEVRAALSDAAERAVAAGVARDRIAIDPGIGFGKSAHGNLVLLVRVGELAALGYPVLIGASRKSFIGKFLRLDVEERLEGSLAAAVAAVLGGADLLRVHDVRATLRAVRLAALIRDAGKGAGATAASGEDLVRA